jgi:HlyD family secretion protein|tara:strand:+ start:1690 stop:2952 length:1263 start_codon:yes stop_codon:yes gene_type:complete
MDRKVAKSRYPVKKITMGVAAVVAIALITWAIMSETGGRSFSIDQDRIVISPVTSGVFEDFIPIRGRVTPRKTVYLDAIEGGRVEERLLEDGTMVKAGDLIVVLSNTSLQLDVTRNQAMVTEQLNNMRTIELQLEQNRLQHKRNLVELDYQIKRLTRQVDRLTDLDESGVVIKSQLEDARDELEYYGNRRVVTLESQETDARLQETQLQFLQETGAQLEQNLALAQKNLDSLNVRAPVPGKLSGLDVETGQSINRGGRLGQIDDPDSFKLRANIDEYYLGRVDTGQSANFERDGKPYELTIAKIYPQVQNGQFEVDLLFTGQEPQQIRRGQTIQARLTLGDSVSAKLIPNGAFYQDTGGNWVFVVSGDGNDAIKRTVQLGRRNSRYIEVLDGLESGERIVTSPYSSFKDMDRLKLGGESD